MKNASGIRAQNRRDCPSRAQGVQRAAWKRLYRLEALESRTLLSTLSFPSAGSLDYVGTSGVASDLTVSTDGTNYTFTDADQVITLASSAITAGWTGSGTNTVIGPNISVTGITISTSTADDTISINSVDASTSIDSGAGNDTISVTANGVAAAATVTIDSSSSSGSESLMIDAGGTPGTYSTGALGRVNYQAAGQGLIENTSSKPSFSESLTGVGSGDLTVNLNTLFASPTALSTTISNLSGELDADVSGVFTHVFPISDLASVSVGGTTAGSGLTLDYSTGDPLPASGLTYDPPLATGNATNTLSLQGGSFTAETYNPTGAGAGSIKYDGTTTITFSNLSPVSDTVPSPTFTFNAPSGATTVNMNTGPIVGGVQTDQINDGGTSEFELYNFANKTTATLNVPQSGATTTINYPAPAAGLTTLDVVSGGGNDTVDVQTSATGVTSTIDMGSGAGSTTNVGLGGSLGAIDGPVFVKSTGGTNTLKINDSSESSAQTYAIVGSQVTATSFPSFIDFSGGGITTLDLTSAGLGDVFNFTGPVQTDVTTYNFSADSGAGPNVLNVTSSVSNSTFSMAGVLGFGSGLPVINYTNFQHISVTKPASPPAGTGVTIAATPGVPLNNVVVANFTQSDLGNTAADFTASINWGDSTAASAGTIEATGADSYEILGSHTYTASGTFTVNVTLTDIGSFGSTTVAGTAIMVLSTGPVNSIPNPIVSTSNSATTPLTAQGATVTGVEGSALSTGTGVLVATFMDPVAPGPPADYTASIVWGDGSAATAATTITSQGTPNGVVFSVFGNHTYAEQGTYAITVTITKTASGATAIASGQAVIADAPLTAAAAAALSAHTGVALAASSIVGTFTDANPTAPISDFTATITWGDGSPESAGTITQPGGVGTAFDVTAGHTYASAGTYDPIIVVSDVGGSKVTLNATVGPSAVITVSDLAPTGVPTTFTAVEGQNTGSIVLATITDPNPLATAADLSASIVNWGDNTPSSPKPLSVVLIGGTATASIFQVLGSHTYAEEGLGLPVTLAVTTAGGVATTFTPATGTANVQDALLSSSNGTTITGVEGVATPATTLIGTFKDANQGATSNDFLPLPTGNGGSVVVSWGDGSAAQTLTTANLSPTPPATQGTGVFTISASHTYDEMGEYAITIVVTDDGGATTTISSTAIIADAPLTATATQPTVSTTEASVYPVPEFGKPLFSGPVGTFTDTDPVSTIADFTATIDWGDGTPLTAGTISQPGGGGTTYVVSGSHTYADSGVNSATNGGSPGTYAIQVFVVDTGGSRLTVPNTATVTDNPIVVTGALNPQSDSSPVSDTNNITNVKQPDFLGTSEPFSSVSLYATPLSGGTATLIGQGPATSDGTWNIVSSVPLADGSYKITATAIDQFGETTTVAPVVITADLVIDTVGPVITALSFAREHGVVNYTIQDPAPGSGVWVNTLLDSSNYLLTKVHANKAYPGKWIATNITVTPIGNNSYNVSVVFNSGKYIRGGYYLFTIRDSSNGNSSIQDIAGNHLDGVFYGTFPSGNGIPGSDFVARLTSFHNKVFPPRTVVGTASAANGGVGGAPLGLDPKHPADKSAGTTRKERAGEKDWHATPQKVTRRGKLGVRVESIRTLDGGSLLAGHRTHDEALAALAGEAAPRRNHG